MDPVHVVVGVWKQGDRFFLAQRLPTDSFPWLWESPGGKVERGEMHDAALRREWNEELGVEVLEVGAHIFTSELHHRAPAKCFIHFYYVEPCDRGWSPITRESTGYGWFTLEEMRTLSLMPGNQLLWHHLTQEDEQ